MDSSQYSSYLHWSFGVFLRFVLTICANLCNEWNLSYLGCRDKFWSEFNTAAPSSLKSVQVAGDLVRDWKPIFLLPNGLVRCNHMSEAIRRHPNRSDAPLETKGFLYFCFEKLVWRWYVVVVICLSLSIQNSSTRNLVTNYAPASFSSNSVMPYGMTKWFKNDFESFVLVILAICMDILIFL